MRYTNIADADSRAIFSLGSDNSFNLFDGVPGIAFFGFFYDLEPVEIVARVRFLQNNIGLALRRVQEQQDTAQRNAALKIFDRTFLITGVLRLLAVAVAFVGVLSALMALQLERTRELGVLRANGLTPGQVWGLVTTQTGVRKSASRPTRICVRPPRQRTPVMWLTRDVESASHLECLNWPKPR